MSDILRRRKCLPNNQAWKKYKEHRTRRFQSIIPVKDIYTKVNPEANLKYNIETDRQYRFNITYNFNNCESHRSQYDIGRTLEKNMRKKFADYGYSVNMIRVPYTIGTTDMEYIASKKIIAEEEIEYLKNVIQVRASREDTSTSINEPNFKAITEVIIKVNGWKNIKTIRTIINEFSKTISKSVSSGWGMKYDKYFRTGIRLKGTHQYKRLLHVYCIFKKDIDK